MGNARVKDYTGSTAKAQERPLQVPYPLCFLCIFIIIVFGWGAHLLHHRCNGQAQSQSQQADALALRGPPELFGVVWDPHKIQGGRPHEPSEPRVALREHVPIMQACNKLLDEDAADYTKLKTRTTGTWCPTSYSLAWQPGTDMVVVTLWCTAVAHQDDARPPQSEASEDASEGEPVVRVPLCVAITEVCAAHARHPVRVPVPAPAVEETPTPMRKKNRRRRTCTSVTPTSKAVPDVHDTAYIDDPNDSDFEY